MEPLGYAHLVDRFALPVPPPPLVCRLSNAVPNRRIRDQGGQKIEEFGLTYAPGPAVIDHLRFALRYEGVNLTVLSLLFERTGPDEIQAALAREPTGIAPRRLAFFYEWLTGRELEVPAGRLTSKTRFISALDESLQFGLDLKVSSRNQKYRVIDNLPGTREFCPLVSRTAYLDSMVKKNLKDRTRATLEKYDPRLVLRAANFLYLTEAHSSFEVERVKPTTTRAQRFADLLRQAETSAPLSEDRFVELQNAVVDPRSMEAAYRLEQNWLGTDFGHRKKVDYVPPRPEDVRSLMSGLVAMAERFRARPGSIDAIVAASLISFGFVFIHPFMDGNGRLHRYLIHEQLSSAGFTPKGLILPVSAVILANLDRYRETLESFSRPVRDRTSYDPDVPQAPATGNDALYSRYFNATDQASFLYFALERTIEHDLDEEISFLMGFDRARSALNSVADWPPHSLDVFIRVVHQNNGKLSVNKRKSRFEWMTDDELPRFEAIVARAFDPTVEVEDIL